MKSIVSQAQSSTHSPVQTQSGKSSIDAMTVFSGVGIVVSFGLGSAAVVSPTFNALLSSGTAALYDAAIWMAEMCRFD